MVLLITDHPWHQLLKGAWSITQAKRHAISLKEAEMCTKGSFGLILLQHKDLDLTTGQINGRKPAGYGMCIQKEKNPYWSCY